MGFRTVIIINNDHLDQVNDPVLKTAVLAHWGERDVRAGPYRLVEQVHTGTDSLIHVKHLAGDRIATANWDHPESRLQLLKEAADAMGYKLIKQAAKK